jgi:hypothetical protein
MIADDTTRHSRGPRLARLAAWVPQLLLAAAMLGAGAGKLAGTRDMVALFEAVGVGQWFRVLTGWSRCPPGCCSCCRALRGRARCSSWRQR